VLRDPRSIFGSSYEKVVSRFHEGEKVSAMTNLLFAQTSKRQIGNGVDVYGVRA
jgi:hypothetical protein